MVDKNIEQCIKRRLSDAEREAIARVEDRPHADRRKAKRLLRQARTKARRAELAAKRREGWMREPSRNEIAQIQKVLSAWQSPEHFASAAESFARRIPTEKLWGNPYKFLREALTLVEYCKHFKPIAVRMGEDPPDAWVRFELDKDEAIEVTEVQEPDRRRGDEYKKFGFGFVTHISDEQAVAREASLISELSSRIEAKAAAKYNPVPRLLVYLNYPHPKESEAVIRKAVEGLRQKHADRLRDIHIVTDRKVVI